MKIVVQVKAGARKEKVVEIDETTLAIDVKEKAKDNKANERVRALVAAHYGVPEKAVRITQGHRAPKKHLEIVT